MPWSQEGWTLLDPWFLAALPVVLAVLLWRLRRPRAALPAPARALLAGLPRSARARLVVLPEVVRALGLCALVLALARPVTREVLPLREEGVDILLVLDVSSSMDMPDMTEDADVRRVEAAKAKATEFAAAREHDRLGLLTFARYPELRCPLTLDGRALRMFLGGVDTVESGGPEDGTAIGAALAAAVRFLADSEAESKVVVLLSDGEETVGEIPPLDAAKLAADADVRVHTIGLGQGKLVPDLLSPGGARLVPADFDALAEIAEMTGGVFFRARDADALGEVYRRIDAMERVELEDPRYRTSDRFGMPLGAGVALLALSLLLETLWFRRAP